MRDVLLRAVNKHCKFRVGWVVCIVLHAFFLCSFELFGEIPSSRSGGDGFVTQGRQAVVAEVCNKILSGDFEDAGTIVANSSFRDRGDLEELGKILNNYEALKVRRTASKKEAYDKQIAKFEKFRHRALFGDPNDIDRIGVFKEPVGLTDIQLSPDIGLADSDVTEVMSLITGWLRFGDDTVRPEGVLPEDPNEIGKFFKAVILACEYGDEAQKQTLLEDRFVQQMVSETFVKAREYEQAGKWVDAYSYGYYWLKTLYEDNTEYEDHAKELLEKAGIVMSLKDDKYGETSAERYKGITAEMLIRAVRTLDFYYVSIISYDEMGKDGIKRCRLLGEVLARPDEDVIYRAESKAVAKWLTGLNAIGKPLKDGSLMTRDKFIKVFNDVIALNSVTISIPCEVVIAQFTEAAFGALDPYTNMIWPYHVKGFQKKVTQQFFGIGIRMLKEGDDLKVVSLIPNTPAYSSGIDVGDIIVAVDGEPTADMTSYRAMTKITGPRGSDVILTIRHSGSEETEDIVITRDKVSVATVLGWQRGPDGRWRHVIDSENSVGYLRITNFVERTVPDMKKVLWQLEKDGLSGLIIDLRSNTGGLLDSAADVVDMFVDEGLIVKSQPRWGMSSYMVAHKNGTHPDYPVVVLLNEASASASEIVAGALQDRQYKRATIVGDRSYGKGSVQEITAPYPDGSQFKFTKSYYHLPSGQRVKNRYIMEKKNRTDWGVAPDIAVKLRTDELTKMFKFQNANGILVKADHDNTADPVKRYSLAETLGADPQLAIGLLVVKSKIIQSENGTKAEFDM